MAILQYWCPTHHTTKRKTRFNGFRSWHDGSFINDNGRDITVKAEFKYVTPICQVCREEMVYAGSNLPRKKRKKK